MDRGSLEGYSPWGHKQSDLKCQCKRRRRCRFNPWVGKIPCSRKWQPTPVCLPGKFHGQRSLVGLQSMGSQRVEHDWAWLCVRAHTHTIHIHNDTAQGIWDIALHWFQPWTSCVRHKWSQKAWDFKHKGKVCCSLAGTKAPEAKELKFLSMFCVLGSCVVGYNYNKKDKLKSQ